MKNKYLFFLTFFVFLPILFQTGVKKKRPISYDYGKVIINNFSEKLQIPPVIFNHWSHRANFTCRLCHIDIGFAMKGNDTKITAQDNIEEKYCGSCHNGKYYFKDKKVFEACSKEKFEERCKNCHNTEKNGKNKENFIKFAENMPKDAFGNEIDWEKAEIEGKLKLIDRIENLKMPKKPEFKKPVDFQLNAKVEGLPNIIFSHKKHTDWMGCEGCHPEIFLGVKKGLTKYSMADIFQGKYCGFCHGSVAFPLTNCQKCHIEKVE